ncbi:TPA: hypothetical protein ACJIKV_004897 [Citrobacter freundii]
MNTVILALMARSCHHNKSQRVDPFIALSRIIAGKTKYVKDPFSAMIHAETSHDAGWGRFYGFWEKWGNARAGQKEGGRKKRRGALREF